jgi:hypothetical protein
MSSAVNAQKYQTLFTPAIAKLSIGDGHAGIAPNIVSWPAKGQKISTRLIAKLSKR